MRANYVQRNSPQFRLLSEKQIEELHFATLQILERTGLTFECPEAIELLGNAGADVSNPDRVKIPSHLVEQALRTVPKTVTLYTREGQVAMVLNGLTPHFGGMVALSDYLDPYTRQKRPSSVEDIGNMARVIDALPNVDWIMTASACPVVPGAIADLLSLLQVVFNSSKPVALQIVEVPNLYEMLEVCAIIAGGEKPLRDKPFLVGTCMPVTPLVEGKDAMEKSLICAEKGIPMLVFSAPMAGATSPATWPAVLALANAEVLGQLVVIQLKKPGAPFIYGAQPSIMDMKTMIFSYGAPESAFMIAALTELCHYYQLPMFGTAGEVDNDTIDAQAAAEATYQILLSALSGADFIHGIGEMDKGKMASPEFAVLGSEIIDMVNVAMAGIEINEDTLPLNLIDRVGPKGSYVSEKHTLQHFRRFWVPSMFDRSSSMNKSVKTCEQMLKEKTIRLLETHKPKPLPREVVKELKRMEKSWFRRVGLSHEYPKKKRG